MDRVKVDIKARETIKPSSPTPHNLKIFNLSLLDQIAPPIYVPKIFYYENNGTKANLKPHERIKLLKESLSQALTRIYPLAGRVKDNLLIEYNDEGAEFLEAQVNFPLHEILRQPEVYVLDQLLPQDYHSNNLEAQLAVQVNFFSYEGMAIGVCMFHKIVDGDTFSSFVNMWAAIARNSGDSLSPIFAIRNAVRKIDKDYTREMRGGNGISLMSDFLEQIGESVPENVEIYRFVSWANLQNYEADFGWGKPVWESTVGSPFKNVIIFIETRVGHGLEAWVSLDGQDMTIFENNLELCSFVSSIENV